MTGSFCYFIGSMAVMSQALEWQDLIVELLPARWKLMLWLVLIVLALAWPLWATLVVVIRLIRALRHG